MGAKSQLPKSTTFEFEKEKYVLSAQLGNKLAG